LGRLPMQQLPLRGVERRDLIAGYIQGEFSTL